MNEIPSASRFVKPLVIGVGLAVLGIGLFLTLYFDLQNQNVEPLTRLLVAMCVPPLAIGVLVGAYALYTRRFSSNKSSDS